LLNGTLSILDRLVTISKEIQITVKIFFT